jgi:hypothetical protein
VLVQLLDGHGLVQMCNAACSIRSEADNVTQNFRKIGERETRWRSRTCPLFSSLPL